MNKNEDEKLFNELKKLSKRANQRILRIERLTGEKGYGIVRQLYDYLTSATLQGISKKGRVRASSKFTTMQMKAIIKATEDFLKNDLSTVAGLKDYKRRQEKEAGIKFDWVSIGTIYSGKEAYNWIIGRNGLTESEFWGTWVPAAKRDGWSVETWTEQLAIRINEEIDYDLKQRMKALYDYCLNY